MRTIEHFPPEDHSLHDADKLLFSAGPIQGAPDWQSRATGLYTEIVANIGTDSEIMHIANPRREYLDDTFDWDAQVDWEEHNLERAATNGGSLFWLAKRDYDLPYEEGRAYAQTTRFEYGDMTRRKMCIPSTNIVLGIEPGYKGSERYYVRKANKLGIEVVDDLEAACLALTKLVVNRGYYGKLLI